MDFSVPPPAFSLPPPGLPPPGKFSPPMLMLSYVEMLKCWNAEMLKCWNVVNILSPPQRSLLPWHESFSSSPPQLACNIFNQISPRQQERQTADSLKGLFKDFSLHGFASNYFLPFYKCLWIIMFFEFSERWSNLKFTPHCIYHCGVTTSHSIHHCGVTTPHCIPHWGVTAPHCMYTSLESHNSPLYICIHHWVVTTPRDHICTGETNINSGEDSLFSGGFPKTLTPFKTLKNSIIVIIPYQWHLEWVWHFFLSPPQWCI